MEQTLQAREHWLGTLLVVAVALLFCAWQVGFTVAGAAMIIGTAVLYTAAVRSFPIVLRITPAALGLAYLVWSGFQTDDVISLEGFCHMAGGVLVTALGCRFWFQSTPCGMTRHRAVPGLGRLCAHGHSDEDASDRPRPA